MGYRPHSLQREILRNPSRFRLAVCGRRWGKSLLASWEALGEALVGQGRVWVIGLTYEQTDRILEPIWTLLARFRLAAEGTKRSERRIHLRCGGFIVGKSADHPDSLVGESLTLAVVDEAPIMRERVWSQALRPCLSDRRGRALFIGTPRGHNWIWDRYSASRREDNEGGDPEWFAWKAPSWTNNTVFPGGREDPEIVSAFNEAQSAGMGPLFDQEYGASFTAMQGRVYQAFDTGKHVVAPVVPNTFNSRFHRFVGGVDYGFANPTALVVLGQTSDGGWCVVDEWYERGKTPDEIVDALTRLTTKWGVRQWWADHEPSQILAAVRRGLPVEKAYKPERGAGHMVVARLMGRDGGFAICRSCPNTIREHDALVWRETAARGVVDEPVKLDDHSTDATMYAIVSEDRLAGRSVRSTRIAGL